MRGLTGLLLAGIAVLAISSCPAWGGIVNGDFSNPVLDGSAGWLGYVSTSDTSLALLDANSGQLHVRVANSYVYNSEFGFWMPQEEVIGGVSVTQNVAPNGGAPMGTTGLQFDCNVTIDNNPAGNTWTEVRVGVNYGTVTGERDMAWSTSFSTEGPQTITINLPDLIPDHPVLDLYVRALSYLNVPWDSSMETSYDIVVDATLDDFKFVPVPDGELVNVLIDIKPGDSANHINLGSNGGIPVAILGTETFDVLQVDPLSVTLADAGIRIRGKGKSIFSTSDVNGDGLLDMILSIETEGLSLAPDATEAVLKGMTYDGLSFQGSDYVMIVGQNSTSSMTLSPLPEPSSIMLLILGGMSVIRRRRLRGKNGN